MTEAEERVSVTTYVPQYQREAWEEHAEELEMSLSEFARTMIQSGRTGFELTDRIPEPEERPPEDVTPGGEGIDTVLVGLLRREGPLDRDGIAERLTGELSEALLTLQDRGTIEHDPDLGWSVVAGADHGE